ncbi:MAG: dienelactone hydrolase family protein [Betaproteobacteria bacterium]|nr:dienelactone hydrolase family protein [Betaproteobacteria bacterium]
MDISDSMKQWRASVAARAVVAVFALNAAAAAAEIPEIVHLDSADGKTRLSGYLYRPDTDKWPGERPGIVLLHGRTGLFSASAKKLDASTLSARTTLWGRFWAERGYVALYVDSFSPRGHARGFAAGTNKPGQRPPEVNEIEVRPLDAYQGLAFLRAQKSVRKDSIFLQGWSNGGTAALAAMSVKLAGAERAGPAAGFRAAISVYPGCGTLRRQLGESYRSHAPLLLLMGMEDEEVSFSQCAALAREARANDVEFVKYDGATHGYDSPASNRTAVAANVAAAKDTLDRAEKFLTRFSPAQAVGATQPEAGK